VLIESLRKETYGGTSAMGNVFGYDRDLFDGKPPLSWTKTSPIALVQGSPVP